ncbi:MAG TPA: hypothetical protein VJ894_02610, partial [Cryomorphaceae bacterium]|nr:hypothetical protein [Cryomorphaceae bacterium]
MKTKYAEDTHSFSEPNQIAATHLDIDLSVSFEDRILAGTVVYDLERNEDGDLYLDADGLNVTAARDADTNEDLQFSMQDGNDYGQRLVV